MMQIMKIHISIKRLLIYFQKRKYMGKFILLIKLIISIALGFLFFLVIDIGVGKILLKWYMSKYHIDQRIEVSEDMGFGMLAGLLFFLDLAVFFPYGTYLAWRWLGQRKWFNH